MPGANDIVRACKETLLSLDAVKRARLDSASDSNADGRVTVHTHLGSLEYAFVVKKSLNHARLQYLLAQSRPAEDRPLLLLADHLSPTMIDRLVESGFQFVDATGNIHLDWPGRLYVLVRGSKSLQLPGGTPERLYQASGLQVLFVLLVQPSSASLSYRELAAKCGVSLGTIAIVMKQLKQRGLLEQMGRKEWALTSKEKLIEQWVGGYGGRLRPKLLLGRYRASEGDLGRTVSLVRQNLGAGKPTWALTGGYAADLLIGHFRGNQLGIFVKDEAIDNLTIELSWLPSREGDITLFRLFSPSIILGRRPGVRTPVAHPLLAYAELVFQGGERELEVARILYQRELQIITHAD